MAYQLARFHDPFAFMKAQAAWGSSPAFLQHLARLVDPAWYAMVVWFAWYMMARLAGFEVPHRFAKPAFVNLEFQFVIDFLALALAILILTKSSLRGAAPIALAGWFVIIGYLWFMATTSNYLVDGIRLIYPAVRHLSWAWQDNGAQRLSSLWHIGNAGQPLGAGDRAGRGRLRDHIAPRRRCRTSLTATGNRAAAMALGQGREGGGVGGQQRDDKRAERAVDPGPGAAGRGAPGAVADGEQAWQQCQGLAGAGQRWRGSG